jgi:hypothetical protein
VFIVSVRIKYWKLVRSLFILKYICTCISIRLHVVVFAKRFELYQLKCISSWHTIIKSCYSTCLDLHTPQEPYIYEDLFKMTILLLLFIVVTKAVYVIYEYYDHSTQNTHTPFRYHIPFIYLPSCIHVYRFPWSYIPTPFIFENPTVIRIIAWCNWLISDRGNSKELRECRIDFPSWGI